jgi:hypothetical protein
LRLGPGSLTLGMVSRRDSGRLGVGQAALPDPQPAQVAAGAGKRQPSDAHPPPANEGGPTLECGHPRSRPMFEQYSPGRKGGPVETLCGILATH